MNGFIFLANENFYYRSRANSQNNLVYAPNARHSIYISEKACCQRVVFLNGLWDDGEKEVA